MITVDKIFVITFPGDLDKKKELFRQRLNAIPFAKEKPFEVFVVPEKDKISERYAENNLRPYENWKNLNAPMNWKERSIAFGHWNVWKKTKEENHRSVLVLEEGFVARASHYAILDADFAWDMIYLGREAHGGDADSAIDGLVTPGYSTGSFAYVIRESAVNKLLSSGYDRNIVPAEDLLVAMHGAHPHPEIYTLFSERFTALAPMRNFIEMDDDWAGNFERSAMEYIPKHPGLFNAFGDDEAMWVNKYLSTQLAHGEYDLICDEPVDNIYSFPLFTPQFCQELIEEAEHFGEWTNYRHQDGPPLDMMLASFNFNEVYSHILSKYVFPLFCYKYKLRGDGWRKMNSQNFIVRYLPDQQAHLGLHNDGSYLSMIVTLNTDFDGGGTYFPKFRALLRHDTAGHAAVHPGLVGFEHGARPVTRGKRYILASFFYIGDKHPITQGAY